MAAAVAVAVVALLLVLYAVALYNRLVVLRNRVDNAWAQVDVQLRRRYDLIPNLVEAVKGYAAHERETFERVTEARARAIAAGSVGEQAQAEDMLTRALRSLFAVAENYPELRASENFRRLQEDLSETEDKIAFARQFYNDTALLYNNLRQSFPAVLLAGALGFGPRDYFEVADQAREPVAVRF
ncbi:MAG: LemA family protein [Armatimonadetes bacterium]|nr:LemA family protein [Armatimonadota bacterium]MDW8154057.1 LemA family protein [Armatimonadota bacterium]